MKCSNKGRDISPAFLMLCSMALGVCATLSLHIKIALPSDTQAGQSILGTAQENTFLPLSLSDVAIFVIFTIAIAVFLFFSHHIIQRHQRHAHTPLPRYFGPLLFVILLLCWSPYLLTWLPGGVYSDTYNVIDQAQGLVPLSNQHTILYTALWWICIRVANVFSQGLFVSCCLMMVLQALCMAGAFSYSVVWLNKHGLGRTGSLIVAIFFCVFPLFPFYVVSLWKDTFFSACLMWYGLCFADVLLKSDPDKIISKRVVLCLSSVLVAFSRNNGVYIVLGSSLILLIMQRKQLKSLIAPLFLPLGATLMLILAVQGPVYSHFNLNNSSVVESLGVPLQQVARVIASDGELSESAEEVFFSILPKETWKEVYRPLLVDSVKWNEKFNTAFLSDHKFDFMREYILTGLHNPMLYFEGFLMSNSGFWNPLVGWNENVAYVQLEMWHPERPPFQIDAFEMITGVSLQSILRPHIFFSCAVFSWIMLVSLSVLLIGRQWKWAMCCIPGLLLWMTLIIASPIGYSLRYCFYLVMAAPFFLALPFMTNYAKPLYAKTAKEKNALR